jgi:hypothetical protein
MTPGTRLRSWAGRLCSPATMQRLIDPVVADLQHEYGTANGDALSRKRGWILLRGYAAFWTMLAMQIPMAWMGQTMRRLTLSDDRAAGRGVLSAIVTMIVLTAVLIAAPLLSEVRPDVVVALLILPQSLPVTLPFSILVGVLAGLRGHPASQRRVRAVLIVGLVGSLTSAAFVGWVVPAANHAYRTTMAGHNVVRGPGELRVGALRQQALAIKAEGRLDWAGIALFSFHSRWAMAGAALTFSLFGLGLTALRMTRKATACGGVVACAVYLIYFFELASVRPSVFSAEWVAFGLAWLPNAVMTLTSLAFLSTLNHTDAPTQPGP